MVRQAPSPRRIVAAARWFEYREKWITISPTDSQPVTEADLMALSGRARAELDELLASMELLSDDDVGFLAELWDKEDEAARRNAWITAKAAIEKAGLMRELDRIRVSVGSWMQANSSDFQGMEGLLGGAGGPAGVRRAAAPAFIDYAAAILAGEALDEGDRRVLVGPWRQLTEDQSEA